MLKFYLILLCLSISFSLFAQNLALSQQSFAPDSAMFRKGYVILKKINIEGNKKTKKYIILRELDVKEGDSISLAKADTILFRNKNKIFNTNLFVTVELKLEKVALDSVNLNIKLIERWYFFPFPLFELSDRNFNEWINTYDADLSRVNYGIRFIQENFRGRNEKLDILLQFGFTQQLGLNYNIPYIDKSQKNGINFGFLYAQNKILAYRTLNHKLDFIDSNRVLRERYEARFSYTRRNAFYSFHRFEMRFHYNQVADTIARLNPKYFWDGKTNQRFFVLGYRFRHDLRDIQAYPLRGQFYQLALEKLGLLPGDDVNMLQIHATYARFRELGNGFFLENQLKGMIYLQNQQPYLQSRAFGYGSDVLRGYELYVIDGQAFALSKNTLRFRLFDSKTQLNFIPIKQFRTIPMASYLTLYFDFGYVRDNYFISESNRFSNRFIYGTGVGLDLFTFYNVLVTFNYSMNADLERGFFLNFKADFN